MSQIHDALRWVINHVTADGSVPPETVAELLTLVDEHESAEEAAAAPVAAPEPVPAAPVPDPVPAAPVTVPDPVEVATDAPAQ